MDFDALLTKIGGFGRYQRQLYLTLAAVAVFSVCHSLGYVFWAGQLDHWCDVPEATHLKDNLTEAQYRNLTIPWETTDEGELVPSKCKYFDRDYENLTYAEALDILANDSSSVATPKCSSWVYDRSQYKSSIVTKWDLVCDHRLLQYTPQSVYMAGRVLGTVTFGHISDLMGRRPALVFETVSLLLFSVASALTPEYYSFCVFRFFTSMSETGLFQIGYILMMETIGVDYRDFAGNFFMVFWALGYLLIARLAYLIRDSLALQLALSVPSVLLCSYYWLVPESPRWLLTKGRRVEGTEILEKMAKVNGTGLPSVNITVQMETKSNTTFVDLFRTPYIRKTTLCLFYIWMVNSFVYYGLSFNTSNLAGNDYINFTIAGAVEIPAYILCYVLMRRIGRRTLLSAAMVMAGLSLLATIPTTKDLYILTIALAMLGKFAITASFGMIYIYTVEVYPTAVRSIGVGCTGFMCRFAGILAPFAAEMDNLYPRLSLILFGSTSLLAGLLIFLLPETKGRDLPSTIDEAERMQDSQNNIRCLGNWRVTRPSANGQCQAAEMKSLEKMNAEEATPQEHSKFIEEMDTKPTKA